MDKVLSKLKLSQNLNFNESKDAFDFIMEGKANEDQIFSFLTLL